MQQMRLKIVWKGLPHNDYSEPTQKGAYAMAPLDKTIPRLSGLDGEPRRGAQVVQQGGGAGRRLR